MLEDTRTGLSISVQTQNWHESAIWNLEMLSKGPKNETPITVASEV